MADFRIGDYQYTIKEQYVVSAVVFDKTKVTYENIPQTVSFGGNIYNVTDISDCFQGCTSLRTAPTIPNNVTRMYNCFQDCTSLITPPIMPNNITSMDSCFQGCTSLTTPPIIPNGVTSMRFCFQGCTSLRTAPTIPNNVTYMYGCFQNCTSLRIAPTIPSKVTNIDSCFLGCTSLTTPPIILSNIITSMIFCFASCEMLEAAPVVPSSVTNMNYCFNHCRSLSGDVYILSNNVTSYNRMFEASIFDEPPKHIVLHTYASQAQAMANTANYNNVTVGGNITPIILNTQFVESGKYRVDMLLNCNNSGSIIGMFPNGKLYDMNDNEIVFGIGNNNTTSQSLRCYAIIETSNRVPTSAISIGIQNVATSNPTAQMATPSTATPSVIKQEGRTNPISSRITISNIRFNPQLVGLHAYTVSEFLSWCGYNTSDNYTKVQTNVDGDVKHFITHASNVYYNNTMTLQEFITARYDDLL